MLLRYMSWCDGVFVFFVLQVEFAVQMTCDGCADQVRAALQGKPGIKTLEHGPILLKCYI